jgi:GT2 family glycosyltransferase
MIDLSVIIVSFNTKEITRQCLQSLQESLSKAKNTTSEVIVIDNASQDGSQEMLKEFQIKTIFKDTNLGFGGANNVALKQAQGEFVLYLNSDVIHKDVNYDELLAYFRSQKDLGALTVKVLLKGKDIDPASHRGFPTPWRSITYYAKLEKLFWNVPVLNKIFGGYHLAGNDLSKEHEVEAITGAYFLSRREILNKLSGFDEDFFMYGEDLDLAFRIKELGYRIMYYPKFVVDHLKYSSGIKTDNPEIRKNIRKHFYEAMLIFYRKHYRNKYPGFVYNLVSFAVNTAIKRI